VHVLKHDQTCGLFNNSGAVLAFRAERRPKAHDGIFFSGWDVRTATDLEPRYNPMSYHNGSI
jgi:hypothetical protein